GNREGRGDGRTADVRMAKAGPDKGEERRARRRPATDGFGRAQVGGSIAGMHGRNSWTDGIARACTIGGRRGARPAGAIVLRSTWGECSAMIRRHAGVLRALLATVDALVVLFSLGLAATVRFGFQAPLDNALSPFGEGTALLLPVLGWPLTLWAHGLYRPRVRLTIRGEALDVLRATMTFTAAILIALYFFKLDDFSRTVVAVFVPTLALSTIAVRIALRAALSALRDRGRNTRHVLVLGTAEGAQWFADRLEMHSELGLRVIGHLTGKDEARFPVTRPILGTLDEIEDVLHSRIVDEVAICLPLTEASRIDSIVRLCEEEGKIVRIPMQVFEHALAAGRVEELDGVPIYSIVSGPDRLAGFIAKRALDIVGAVVAGVILSPIMIGLAIAIRLDSPGPVLFFQRRV